MFEKFRAVYPVKKAKQRAETKFKSLSEDLFPVIIEAIEQNKKSNKQRKNPQYIPHPTTWLN